jgi:hypothetical protein
MITNRNPESGEHLTAFTGESLGMLQIPIMQISSENYAFA